MEGTGLFTGKYLHTVSNFCIQHYQHWKSINIYVFAVHKRFLPLFWLAYVNPPSCLKVPTNPCRIYPSCRARDISGLSRCVARAGHTVSRVPSEKTPHLEFVCSRVKRSWSPRLQQQVLPIALQFPRTADTHCQEKNPKPLRNAEAHAHRSCSPLQMRR